MRTSWPRLGTLLRADWGVLLRCLWLIPAAEFSVRWRSPKSWLPVAAGAPGSAQAAPAAAARAEAIARWVDAAYRRSPFRPTCLTRSLVLYRILLARGIPCQLHIGLRKEKAGLEGHAWLDSGEAVADPAGFEVFLSV